MIEPASRSFPSVRDVATHEGADVPSPRWTDEQLRTALADPAVTSLADVCRALGLVPRGANYATLRAAASRLGLDLDALGADRATPARPGRGRRSYTDERLLAALGDPDVDSYPALCHALGLQPNSTTYRRLREHAAELGATVPASWSRRGHHGASDRDGRRETVYPAGPLHAAVQASASRREAIERLGDSPGSTSYAKLQRSIELHGVDTSHLDAHGVSSTQQRTPLDQLLTRGQYRTTSRLRRRLIAEGLRARRCDRCRGEHWMAAPIPLELDHIDGDPTNNELANLRLLCPNCHAQTPTYRGRNIGRSAATGSDEASSD